MRICIVSKFPPIEGGISARTYWRVRRLLEEGHEVAVVTNAGVTEREYCIPNCDDHLRELASSYPLEIYNVSGEAPWHIPSGPDHLERLLSLLLSVLKGGRFALLESGYLVPYGIAAGLASKVTGIPHVARHGGSDLAKLLPDPEYYELLAMILRDAEKVISDEQNEPLLRSAGARTELAPTYAPESRVFYPKEVQRLSSRPTYAYIGKINYHWRRRGLDKIVEWHRNNAERVGLRIVGQGVGRAAFEDWMCRQSLPCPTEVESFVPPWKMAELLAGVDAIFCLSVADPISSDSMIRREALAMNRLVLESVPPSQAERSASISEPPNR